MEPLIKKLLEVDVELYTIGSNSHKLFALAKSYNLNVKEFNTLKEAQEAINRCLKPTEVALLSPAASSLDQFSSYAQRGDQFVEFVKNL